jgi:predicted RNase H-like HicB family nuclease
MDTYLILIGKTATGYSAHCPDVLGCAATGKSVEEVIKNMKEALEFHFEGMAEDSEAIPPPGGIRVYQDLLQDPEIEDYLLAHVAVPTPQPT